MKKSSIIVFSILAILLVSPIAYAIGDIPPEATGKIGVPLDTINSFALNITKPSLLELLLITPVGPFGGEKRTFDITDTVRIKLSQTSWNLVCDNTAAYISAYSWGNLRAEGFAPSTSVSGPEKLVATWFKSAKELGSGTFNANGFLTCRDSVETICKNNVWRGTGNICDIKKSHPTLAPRISDEEWSGDFVIQTSTCVPTEEICDGKDNNCNQIIDEKSGSTEKDSVCKCQANVKTMCVEQAIYYVDSCGKQGTEPIKTCVNEKETCVVENGNAICKNLPTPLPPATCGKDGNLDGKLCDPGEDEVNCPSDCKEDNNKTNGLVIFALIILGGILLFGASALLLRRQ